MINPFKKNLRQTGNPQSEFSGATVISVLVYIQWVDMCENSLDILFVYVREEKTVPDFIIQTSLKEVNSMDGNEKTAGCGMLIQ